MSERKSIELGLEGPHADLGGVEYLRHNLTDGFSFSAPNFLKRYVNGEIHICCDVRSRFFKPEGEEFLAFFGYYPRLGYGGQ